MWLKTEVAANQENNVPAIHELSMELEKVKREVSTLTKFVRDVKDIVMNKIKDKESFKRLNETLETFLKKLGKKTINLKCYL